MDLPDETTARLTRQAPDRGRELRELPPGERDWSRASVTALIEHIQRHFHARHREQLPALVRLAGRVEQLHGAHADCPHGLAELLMAMQQQLESHMMKEEQILFPLLERNPGAVCQGPMAVIHAEHGELDAAVQRVRQLLDGGRLPHEAGEAWRTLYKGLAQFEDELRRHMHLENDILFEAVARAARSEREAGQGDRQ
ncbi:hemerythrin domain-containing protein [Caldimonas tepidiphila]|uniref:hemerythrin domain-containing protein n=1 Tax=Caldimonas tepidiphila TaxID=2315841 RepID=UPI0013007C86|nr:hemerythrin domain-containing protein [Caldimonas tepidiphila]